jgi:hypothetical protein
MRPSFHASFGIWTCARYANRFVMAHGQRQLALAKPSGMAV